MSNIPFSVVMSVYDKDNAAYFDRALQSITVQQTILPNEIVLICDGMINDELNNIVKKYQSKYSFFNVIRLEKNQGLGNALKIAVENATNELIARMDSDDVAVQNRFEQQLYIFKAHPDIDVVGGDITEFIGEETNIVGKRCVPVRDAEIKAYMKKRCAMNHVSVMYKKSAIQSVGGYLEWFWNEDYYLWIRMQLNHAIFANTGTVLVNVRVGKEMYKRRGGKKYYISEVGLQQYMLKHGMINKNRYVKNVIIRLIVERLLPNTLRGFVFRNIAHKLK